MSRGERSRIRTFVNGLDENLSGGIPKGNIILVSGAAGTMKSSLAFYILHQNAVKEGIKALYISLEQNKPSLMRQMDYLHMPGNPENLVEVLDLGEIRLQAQSGGWFDTFRFAVEESKKRMNYDILVIDSLGALELIAKFEQPREEIFRLFEWLRSTEVTTFMIAEMPVGQYQYYGSGDTDFLADGIIHLKMVEVGEIEVQRRLRVVKMRETDHSSSYFSFYFKEGTFYVTRAITDF